ncbi:MAG: DUF1992 domain-containing protein [Bacillota bacterium]
MSEHGRDPKPEKLSRYWVREEPSPIREKGIRDWVEEQIQEAIARGSFANLPGKGRPLNLGPDHPWEEKDWMTNHILANAKVLPEWMELERQIAAELAWLKEHPRLHPEREERITLLNRLIDRFNFVVPLGNMQRAHYRE